MSEYIPKEKLNYTFYKWIHISKDLSDLCYVGSTANLSNRKRTHKNSCNNPNFKDHNILLYKTMRENGGFNNFKMVILGTTEQITKREAQAIEEQYRLKEQATLNSIRCYRTEEQKKEDKKQYNQDHKEEITEQKKQYYEANKAKILEYHKQYQEDHKDELAEKNKQYYQDNKEEIVEKAKKYYQDNKEKTKQYLQANKETITERKKQYYQANKALIKEKNKQRQAEKAEYNKQYYLKRKALQTQTE